jgi:hypothetical protein
LAAAFREGDSFAKCRRVLDLPYKTIIPGFLVFGYNIALPNRVFRHRRSTPVCRLIFRHALLKNLVCVLTGEQYIMKHLI